MNGLKQACAAGLVCVSACVWTGGCAPATRSLEAPEPLATERATDLRQRATAVLLEAARGSEGWSPQQRANAIEAGSAFGEWFGGEIRAGLDDETIGVRTLAALAIGDAGVADEPSIVRLAELARDGSTYERIAALYAISKSGLEVNLGTLAETLLIENDPRLRAHAAMVLGRLGDGSAVPLLYEASSQLPRGASAASLRLLQLQIAQSLAQLGEADQVQVLRAALYPSRPEELEATAVACQMLGELDDRSAVDELIYVVERRDERGVPLPPEVRLSAVTALGKLGIRRGAIVARALLEHERVEIRAQAAVTLGWAGEVGDAGLLAAALSDPDSDHRLAAAIGIVRLLGPESVAVPSEDGTDTAGGAN